MRSLVETRAAWAALPFLLPLPLSSPPSNPMAAPQFTVPPVLAEPTYQDAMPFGFLRPLGSLVDRLGAARDALNLPDPGKAEDLGREVKSEYSLCAIPTTRGMYMRASNRPGS